MNRSKDKHHSSDERKQHRKPSTEKKHPDSGKAPEQPAPEPMAQPMAVPSAEAGPAPIAPEQKPVAADQKTSTEIQLQDQLLRFRADFDNFRKRVVREKTELFECATQDLMIELLPVLDHFQLAIQAAIDHQADNPFREGLEMISNQLMGVLTKFGLSPFDAEKLPFDPSRFEAVNYISSDKEPEGMIIAQTRRGYLLHNKLLRPAQVIVSSGRQRPIDDTQQESLESAKE